MKFGVFGRIAAFVVVTALVLGISLYWNQGTDTTTNFNGPRSESDNAVRSYNWSDWDLPASAEMNLSEAVDPSGFPGNQGLDLPGRVRFLGGDSEPVELKLHVQAIDTGALKQRGTDDPNRLSGLASMTDSEQILRDGTVTATIRTDTSGRFRLSNAPAGLYRATVSDSDWIGQTRSPHLETPSDTKPLRFTVRRHARLTGTVTDARGNPLSDVTLRHSGRSSSYRTTGSGRFTINRLTPNRNHNFTVTKPGYASTTVSLDGIEPGKTHQRTIQLNPYGGLEVTVRSHSGGPIDTGTLQLTRVEEPESPTPTFEDVAASPLATSGQQSFTKLSPGRYVLNYQKSQYLSEPKTLSVPAGDTPSITLRPRRMDPITLGVVDASSGRPLPFLVPDLTAFDNEGNRLEPGIFVRDFSGDGRLSGYVHPDMRKARAVVESGRITDSPRKFTFDRSDLPSVELPVDVQSAPGTSRTATLNLQVNKTSRDNRTVTGAQVFVIDHEANELTLARGGNADVLNEPLLLPGGTYSLYGIVKFKTETAGVFHRTLGIAGGGSITERIQLSVPATVTGTLEAPDDSNRSYRVGLLAGDGQFNNPGDSLPHIPAPLQTTAEPNGQFEFNLVPPGINANLLVFGTDPESEDQTETILKTQSLRPLGRNETLSLGTITLSP